MRVDPAMSLVLFLPCVKMVGAVLLARVVWWAIADLVLDKVDLPLF
jgi:hypothetical protein